MRWQTGSAAGRCLPVGSSGIGKEGTDPYKKTTAMKILITHNDYGRHSGEEAVVDKMGAMMTAHGHQISFYRPNTVNHQKGLTSKIRMFLSGIYSYRGVRGIRKALRTAQPDIINIHNLYPFISPAALFACKAAGIPVV